MSVTKVCARCGKRLSTEYLVSAHTRLRYCIDIDACGRRAKRANKAAA